MYAKLRPNQGIPASLLWLLAVVSGVAVANLYYNQPLLNLMARDLQVSAFRVNLIPMVTQIGYALGLLFIIPLGDLFQRRHIVVTNFCILVAALLAIAASESLHAVLAASLLTGICSVMPQIFIPIAAQCSQPEYKARNMGLLVSGLLTGILASRVVSGLVGEYCGWRIMYLVAAALMALSAKLVWWFLPDTPINFRGNYGGLMRSLCLLFWRKPTLRFVSLRAGLCFGSFLALWTCLAFRMSGAPFYAGNHIVGLMGFCGIAGALTASMVGRYVQVWGVRRISYAGCVLMLLAWAVMYVWQDTYVGLAVGIILLDCGMQFIQIGNQSCALAQAPQATSRANTIFMTTYFVGGSLGTLLGGTGWQVAGWTGTVICGAGLCGAALLLTLLSRH